MPITRRLESQPLCFDPGQPAVTPLDVTAPEGTITVEQTPSPALKGVLVYLTEADAIALKVFAAQNRTSIQRLGIEAWGRLFHERGIGSGHLTTVKANRRHGARR